LNTIELVNIPSAVDREGQTIKYQAYEAKKSVLPNFMRLNLTTNQFEIAPTILDRLDKYTIQLDLSDPFLALNSYTFEVSLYDPSSFT
jgi:hypothetical protein